MRFNFNPLWEAWMLGGPFVGDRASHGRVTVEEGWWLNLHYEAGLYVKTPLRWWHRMDHVPGDATVETEVPNVKSIDVDVDIKTDAGKATILIYNQKMLVNSAGGSSSPELGQPGYYGWRYRSPEANARWGPRAGTEWLNVLVPDALIRTYQGYGGQDKSIADAVADGNIICSGTWLVDDVNLRTDGMIELTCRDMAKLLIEQPLYPPLVPAAFYPWGLRYYRWVFTHTDASTTTVPGSTGNANAKRAVYQPFGDSAASATDVYAGEFDGAWLGHHPHDAFDGDPDTYWISVGNDGPEEPFAIEWIEAACGDQIDTVFVNPWAGNYRLYVSVMENGAWVDEGAGTIPYDPAGVGQYVGANDAAIPYVIQVGVSMESPTSVTLPRSYIADKVRFTFSNLYDSGIGPYPFRAGVRELGLSVGGGGGQGQVVTTPASDTKSDGNYLDYSDIVKDFALWSGFYAHDPAVPNPTWPQVWGFIEPTGIADTGDGIPESTFDKKPVIDGMHVIRDIVGYHLWVDFEGILHFESPNWWRSGNIDQIGVYIDFIPEIDERVQLTDYSVKYSDQPVRSEIIVASAEPTANLDGTVVTRYTPPVEDTAILRGIVKPMMVGNELLTDPQEQLTMAQLIATHIHQAAKAGSVTCPGNPCISINDQIRAHERVTGETGIHYIRGARYHHDLDTGQYTMTLNTYWIGGEDGFMLAPPRSGPAFGWYYHLPDSDVGIDAKGTPRGGVGPDGGYWGYGPHR